MAEIFGVSLEALVVSDEEYLTFVHPDDRAMVRKAILPFDGISDNSVTECRIVRPDGEARAIGQPPLRGTV